MSPAEIDDAGKTVRRMLTADDIRSASPEPSEPCEMCGWLESENRNLAREIERLKQALKTRAIAEQQLMAQNVSLRTTVARLRAGNANHDSAIEGLHAVDMTKLIPRPGRLARAWNWVFGG
jgi:hypothetical protein